MNKALHTITNKIYTLDDFRMLLETQPKIALAPEVLSAIDAGASFVKKKSQEDIYIYGVNTGYGSLCETRVDATRLEDLQYKHLISHACGVGEPADDDVVRLMIIIKLLTFRTGVTGISREPVLRLVDFWNEGILPVIPRKGTVGASGDLAPLAHLSLPIIGLGQVYYQKKLYEASEIHKMLGWKPVKLKPKEGLALTNGVQYINAMAIQSLLRIEEYVHAADVLAAMSIQGFSASKTFYQALYIQTAYHKDRCDVAENLRNLLDNSNHFTLSTCNKSKQDPYSFRCTPQVHAAVRQTFNHAKDVMEKECNSVSDNPLFFPEHDEILFGGNLHGESTAFVLDFLAIALSELAYISERRTYQMLSGQRGLPSFLINNPGLDSGMMVVQYTSAALVNENKVLSTPASIDTIPTCQLQEDSVSMGGTSGYKLWQIAENCETIFAIELLIGCQAIDMNKGLQLSSRTRSIHEKFRKEVAFLDADRIMSVDINRATQFFRKMRRIWRDELK